LYKIPDLFRIKSYGARESLGKGEDKLVSETFQSDPAGNQSCPVEHGEQPEASLARTGVTRP